MPKPPRAPDDGSQPPAAVLYFIAALLVGLPTLASVLEWFGISWRAFLSYGQSDNWIIAAIFAPLVVVPLIILIVKLWQGHIAAKWQQTTGRIVKSEMESQHHQFAGAQTTVRNVPNIEYEFSVGPQTYRGARIAITDTSGPDAEAALDRYPVGKTVTVFYDPTDPNNCVLEREIPKELVPGCMLILAALAVGVVGFYFAVTNAERLLEGVIPAKGNAPVTVFATCFGLAVLWFFFGYRHYLGQAAKWPTVSGKIEKSTIESFIKRENSRNETIYVPAVEYAYEVRGRQYRSRQLKLGVEISGSKFIAEKIVAKYPQGSGVSVHYDSENPSSAMLESPHGYPWLLLGIAVICFGIAVYASAIFR